MKYETVIFDFDGTLLYTIEDLALAANYALEKHGYPTHSTEKIERFVGNGVNMLMARALPLGFQQPDYEQVMSDFRAYYSRHCADHTRPYDGIPELLRSLKAQGRRLAIVTNKYQTAAEELSDRFFAGSVGVVVGDFPGRARKPAPDAVNEALRLLNAGRESAVYVGDTEVDMQTADNSGLACVCVSWGYRSYDELVRAGAPAIARSAAELAALL